MQCYPIAVPEKVSGVLADGRPTAVLPGEYLVHRLQLRGWQAETRVLLRFAGADPLGRDVHIDLAALREVIADEDIPLELREKSLERANGA